MAKAKTKPEPKQDQSQSPSQGHWIQQLKCVFQQAWECNVITVYLVNWFLVSNFFSKIFENFSKNFRFWLGGAAPQTPRILAGGASPPQTPPLTDIGRGAAAPRTPRVFFFRLRRHARRPDVRPDVRPNARAEKIISMHQLRFRIRFYDSFFFSKPDDL